MALKSSEGISVLYSLLDLSLMIQASPRLQQARISKCPSANKFQTTLSLLSPAGERSTHPNQITFVHIFDHSPYKQLPIESMGLVYSPT